MTGVIHGDTQSARSGQTPKSPLLRFIYLTKDKDGHLTKAEPSARKQKWREAVALETTALFL